MRLYHRPGADLLADPAGCLEDVPLDAPSFVTVTRLPNLISHIAPIAERYLTLLRVHPTNRYSYATRGYHDMPVIEFEQHGPKCRSGESWLYCAVPAEASLASLTPEDRLYVGAQTQDRMFRGDGLGASNYHHAEMRAGRGSDTPIAYLNSGRQIVIYRIPAHAIAKVVNSEAALDRLRVLLIQARTPKKHLGWWFEQYVLHSEANQWRWNTAPASRSVAMLFPT